MLQAHACFCLHARRFLTDVTHISQHAWQVWDPEKIVIIPDHYIFTSDPRANRNVDILRSACTALLLSLLRSAPAWAAQGHVAARRLYVDKLLC